MTLLFNTSFFIVGAVLSATGDIYALFIGRFISGIGVGTASSVPSVLLAEIATDETRGTITTLHQVKQLWAPFLWAVRRLTSYRLSQLGITTGIFFASILGYGMVTYVNHGWQYIQVKLPICAFYS